MKPCNGTAVVDLGGVHVFRFFIAIIFEWQINYVVPILTRLSMRACCTYVCMAETVHACNVGTATATKDLMGSADPKWG